MRKESLFLNLNNSFKRGAVYKTKGSVVFNFELNDGVLEVSNVHRLENKKLSIVETNRGDAICEFTVIPSDTTYLLGITVPAISIPTAGCRIGFKLDRKDLLPGKKQSLCIRQPTKSCSQTAMDLVLPIRHRIRTLKKYQVMDILILTHTDL